MSGYNFKQGPHAVDDSVNKDNYQQSSHLQGSFQPGPYQQATTTGSTNCALDPAVNTLYPNGVSYGQPLFPEAIDNPNLTRFVKQGFKDVWAAVIFILLFLMAVVWGIVNAITYEPLPDGIMNQTNSKNETGHSDIKGIKNTDMFTLIFLLIGGFVASVAAASISLVIIRLIPKQLIYVANIFVVLLYIVGAVFAFYYGVWVGGVVFVILAVIQLIWFVLVRRRIAFAAALLSTSTKVISIHPGLFLNNFVFSLISFGFTVCWCYLVLPPVDKIAADVAGSGTAVLLAFFVFVAFWVYQVFPNVMHVTTAGVVATWYFAGVENMPSMPTLHSLKRAMTTSFGSICFGSLIVAIIQFLRWLAESSRGDGNGNLLTCILICLLSCIESMMQYFNTYAFVHVAIYGCGYIEAAQRTFGLLKRCLFTALFNDCLVDPTLTMLAFAMAAVIGVIFGTILWSWPLGLIIFVMAWTVHVLFFTVISSAVTTIFVCFAEVPEALQRSDPALYLVILAADNGETNNNAPPDTL